MPTLLLRLAGPAQSWAGYRLLANKHSTPTAPVPRKSAVAGLLGACLGTRDLDALGETFTLFVRIDRANPVTQDLQVLTPLPPAVNPLADRAEKMRTATMTANVSQKKRPGGALATALTHRDFLPHTEFIIGLSGSAHDTTTWLAAIKAPTFMTYLGRRANPPTYPFFLGVSATTPAEALGALPRAHWHHDPRSPDEPVGVRFYEVTGNYFEHQHHLLGTLRPPSSTREEQLTWASTHLTR